MINNKYLADRSGLIGLAAFGNIQRKYMDGAKGKILAEKIQQDGNKWFFVVMDKESNIFITHNPIEVDVGWVASYI